MHVQSFRTSPHLSVAGVIIAHLIQTLSSFFQGYFSTQYNINEVIILYLIVCIKNNNFTWSKHDWRTTAQESTHCLSDWSMAENIRFPSPTFGFGDHLAMPPCHCHCLILLLNPRHSALSWLPTSEQTPSERKTPTFSLRWQRNDERGRKALVRGKYTVQSPAPVLIFISGVYEQNPLSAYKWYRWVALGKHSNIEIVWIYIPRAFFLCFQCLTVVLQERLNNMRDCSSKWSKRLKPVSFEEHNYKISPFATC